MFQLIGGFMKTIKGLNIVVSYKNNTYLVKEVTEFAGDFYVDHIVPLGFGVDCLSDELRHEISWYKQNTIKSGLLRKRH
jgi:hypothetical protein